MSLKLFLPLVLICWIQVADERSMDVIQYISLQASLREAARERTVGIFPTEVHFLLDTGHLGSWIGQWWHQHIRNLSEEVVHQKCTRLLWPGYCEAEREVLSETQDCSAPAFSWMARRGLGTPGTRWEPLDGLAQLLFSCPLLYPQISFPYRKMHWNYNRSLW